MFSQALQLATLEGLKCSLRLYSSLHRKKVKVFIQALQLATPEGLKCSFRLYS